MQQKTKNWRIAEIKLSYKPHVILIQQPKITNSSEAYSIFLDYWEIGKIQFVEQFKIMLLSRANNVIGIVEISTGTTTATIADSKLIFATALKTNACSIILAHNHPSGNMQPSKSDIELTYKLIQAGKFLDVSVFDHLIVTSDGYFSMIDEKLI